MRLFRLPPSQHAQFLALPEAAMGLQFALGSEDLVFVVGGEVVLDPNDAEDATVEGLLTQPWLGTGREIGNRANLFEHWLASLPVWSGDLAHLGWPEATQAVDGLERLFFHLYGHLPFAGATEPNDVFYRWEPWPVSRRINQTTRAIASGTYMAPYSEAPFAPTGFSAVGRFALPNLAPACFRWELRPPEGTPFRCGASVPLFGQSGGGVEAEFTTGFSNVGPIANPVILRAL